MAFLSFIMYSDAIMNNNNEKFNEYFWELHLREDDRKLHSCMAAIPDVIDLPGEDDILMTRTPDKEFSLLDTVNIEELFLGTPFDPAKFIDSDNMKNSEWLKVYSDLDRLMRSWAVYYVDLTDNFDVLRILCLYARILGMSVNIINYTNEGQKGLLKAVSKRMIAKLNKILILIENGNFDPVVVKNHKLGLFRTRSLVMNLLFAIKRKQTE